MIVKGRFMRGNLASSAKHLIAHLRYLEHRRLDESHERPEDRHLFNQNRDHVERIEAVHDVMEHTSTRVHYHKLVLSPGTDEPVEDYRQWTRAIMQDLEEYQRTTLHWYASYHANTDNPHVHVVLAGTGEDLHSGEQEPVTLYRQDYDYLREWASEHSEHNWYVTLMESLEEFHDRDTIIAGHELPDLEHGVTPQWGGNHDEGKDYEP